MPDPFMLVIIAAVILAGIAVYRLSTQGAVFPEEDA